MDRLLADRFVVDGDARAGGMGSVYRARDTKTGAIVALKVLRPRHDEHDADRFAREAQALAEMDHPAIVRYVAHGAAGEEHFLAMEWLEGEDLAARVKRAPLTLKESLRLGRRVAIALGHAHAHGVIHRDVKPANVYLVGGSVDDAKLIDFGIARLDTGTPLTRAGMMVGTPGYIAPEQARGDAELGPRADLFGLGCVLYRCLTGRVAFPGETAVAVLAKILFDEVPPVSESAPDVPAALDALVSRLLAKAPEHRPASALEVASALEHLEASIEDAPGRATIPAPASLTTLERRLVSVVLVAGPGDDEDSKRTATLDTIPLRDLAPTADPVRAAVSAFGARAERLADGTLVLTLAGQGSATDRAAHAARCALAVRALLPSGPMSLATGHGLAGARVPLGDAIDRATQMLAAEQGREGVPIDDVTAGLLDARFEVGGDAASILLLAERSSADSARRLLGKESPFVGREREIGTLVGLFQECVSEPAARAALVTAPAGMGKSRLRYELLRRIAQEHPAAQIWIARGDAMTSGSPFGLISQVVRRAAGVVDGEPNSLAIRKLRARVARRVPDERAERVAEFLGEIAGVPFPDEDRVQLRAARRDPQLLGDQARRAWEELIEAESEDEPLVLVLEDLHWGDLPSVRLVDVALARSHDRPLFVLALARPEVKEAFPGLWSERVVLALPLGELTRKASEKLVLAMLGDSLDPTTITRLVAQAAGNALYLEELIRAVAEGKHDTLPATVLAMVQARVERLEDEARRVLRAASVFGERFWSGGVRALLGGLSSEQLGEWLALLERREVVTCRPASSIGGEVEYTFRHALVRDAAYASLTAADRELGHRLAGEWLERGGLGDASVLAGHFEVGGDARRAAELYVVAAEQAIAGNDYAAALARAERGTALGATGRTLGMLRLRQAEAHHWRGEYAESAERAREALGLLASGNGPWYAAVAELGVSFARRGRQEEAQEAAELLLATEPLSEGQATCIASAVRIAGGVVRLGMHDLTSRLSALVERLAPPLVSEPSVACRLAQLRAMRAYFAGDHEVTVRVTREAVAAFERAGDLRNATGQRFNVSASCIMLGSYVEGEAEIRRALADAARMDMRHSMLVGRFNLVAVLNRLGQIEEARAVGEQLALDCNAREAKHFEGNARTYLAEVLMMSGAWDDAEREAGRAVELLAATPAVAAYPTAILSRVLLAKGEVGRARELSKAAVEISDKLGAGLEESDAMARLTYAEILRAMGAHDEARDAIHLAADRVRLRASRITDDVVRGRFLSRVWENARVLELEKEWGS
ncbi:MAG TPA: protein kinase [Polyangiaceae bacterium]|nr:protein kinase [Polyangiaceae bacterium]